MVADPSCRIVPVSTLYFKVLYATVSTTSASTPTEPAARPESNLTERKTMQEMSRSLVLLVRGLVFASATFTTLFSILAGVMFIIFNNDGVLSLAIRLVACAFVVGVGILTGLQARSSGPRYSAALFAAAVGIVVLGAAGFAWAIHLGQTTGDFEYYMIMLHMALVGQGAITLRHLRSDEPEVQPA